MNTQFDASSDSIYFLKECTTRQQLSSAINRCLCQAEALAVIATIIDVEAIESDVTNNFLWALSDMVHETKWLYTHLMNIL